MDCLTRRLPLMVFIIQMNSKLRNKKQPFTNTLIHSHTEKKKAKRKGKKLEVIKMKIFLLHELPDKMLGITYNVIGLPRKIAVMFQMLYFIKKGKKYVNEKIEKIEHQKGKKWNALHIRNIRKKTKPNSRE